MSEIDWAAKSAFATKMISKYGRADTILMSMVKPTDYKEDVSYVPMNCKAVKLEYEAEDIKDTPILLTDSNILMSIDGLGGTKPKPQDEVIFNGETFIVQRCKTFAPAGVDVFYDLWVR